MTTIFNSTSILNGHSWTIVTIFGHILLDAQEKYGERDKSYTILGIEINDLDYPQIWYPGNRKDIVIQITKDCINCMNQAVYQVAHETIHCIFATQGQPATVLEEGLATHFALEYCKNNGYGNWEIENKKYETAMSLVEQILRIDPEIILKIRDIQPTISLATKQDIIEINSNISDELAERLTQIF